MVGALVVTFFTIPKYFKATFVLLSSFNNSVSLPLLLMDAIATQSEELHDDKLAYDRAVIYIFIYSVRSHLYGCVTACFSSAHAACMELHDVVGRIPFHEQWR